VSTARKLVIAGLCGCIAGAIPYVWGRYRAATIIVPVSGQITVNGRPLANTYVKFSPVPRPGQSPLDTNPGSHGVTDAQGCFTLQQIENDQPGVIVGEHRILMRSDRFRAGPNGHIVDERVPFSWRKGLRLFHVSWVGTRQADFRIEMIDEFYARKPIQPSATKNGSNTVPAN
jgi:hypothetical protein